MSGANAVWHIPGEGNQPAGPFTADQVFQRYRSGEITETTLCWRDGLPDWQPLNLVEPFATAIRKLNAPDTIRFRCACGHELFADRQFAGQKAKCSACGQSVSIAAATHPTPPLQTPAGIEPRLQTANVTGLESRLAFAPPRRRRILRWAFAVAVLLSAAAIVYVLVPPWLAVRQAKQSIAQSDYDQVSRKLSGVLDDHWYNDYHPSYLEAVYLSGIAEVYEYATADGDQGRSIAQVLGGDPPLRSAARQIKRAINANAKWRDAARLALADASDRVPQKAPDVFVRILAIAQLREEFKTASPAELGRELLERLTIRAANNKGRPRLDKDVVAKIVAWDSSLAGKIVELVLPANDAASAELALALEEISLWAQAQPALTQSKSSVLLRRADDCAAAKDLDKADLLLRAVGQTGPDAVPVVTRKRLDYAGRCLAAKDPAGARRFLDGTAPSSDPEKAEASRMYADLAVQLCDSDLAAARTARARSHQLAPDIPQTEDVAFLDIKLATAADQALQRQCRKFVEDYGESEHVPEALMIIVSVGTGGRPPEVLKDAEAAAEELLQKYPRTAGLDARVFGLASALAKGQQRDQALRLAALLLKTFPKTALKIEINQKIAEWRRDEGRGTLSPDLDALADRVEKELKIQTLDAPGALRALLENPRAAHVLDIRCEAKTFSSDDREMLKRWVSGGGIVWTNTDVLTFFDIRWERGGGGWPECRPAVSEEICPIVTGCSTVRVRLPYGHTKDLSHKAVTPLLASKDDTPLSLVRFGQGWVLNVKEIDTASYDGARFWLNLRLFCLGWPIPGASPQQASPPTPAGPAEPKAPPRPKPNRPEEEKISEPKGEVTKIATQRELKAALEKPDEQRVMWVQLEKDEKLDDDVKKLRSWVKNGGVLWLDTNLARQFGLDSKVKEADGRQGTATVPASSMPVIQRITKDLTGKKIGYSLSSAELVVRPPEKKLAGQKGYPKPLLVRDDGMSVCSIHEYARGWVVYRPTEIDQKTQEGREFLSNLVSVSLELAEEARTQPASKEKAKGDSKEGPPRPRRGRIGG